MRPKKLIKELEKQLRKEKDNLVVRLKLAAAYRDVGRTSEAVELYRSVALAYHESGRLAQASAVCRSVLEIEPGQPETLALLAQLDQSVRYSQSFPSVSISDEVSSESWMPSVGSGRNSASSGSIPQAGGGAPTPTDRGHTTGPRLIGRPLPGSRADSDSFEESREQLDKSWSHAGRERSWEGRVIKDARSHLLRDVPAGDSSSGFSSTGSLMIPTPLPSPLSPHDADDEDSVVDDQIARYPLPLALEPSDSLPKVSLPEGLTPLDEVSDSSLSAKIPASPILPPTARSSMARASSPTFTDDDDDDVPTQVGQKALDNASALTTPQRQASVPPVIIDMRKPLYDDDDGEPTELATRPEPPDMAEEPAPPPASAAPPPASPTPPVSPTPPPATLGDSKPPQEGRAKRATLPYGAKPDGIGTFGQARSLIPQPSLTGRPRHSATIKLHAPADSGELEPGMHTVDVTQTPLKTPISAPAAERAREMESEPALAEETIGVPGQQKRADSTDWTPADPPEETAKELNSEDVDLLDTLEKKSKRGEEDATTSTSIDLVDLPPRADGLPHVIHDDMELGPAFRMALGEGLAISDAGQGPLSIFAQLPEDAVGDLAQDMMLRHFQAGEYVVREGDQSEACYIVVTGELSIEKRDPMVAGSSPAEVARVRDGALFGEHALLANRRCHASVRAVSDCHIYEISRRLLRELAASYDDVGPLLEQFYRDRLLINLTSNAPFLRTLPEKRLTELRTRFETMRFETGESVIREGNRGGGLYLVVTGSLDITKRGGAKRSTLLATLTEGSYVADMALAVGVPACASVRAAEPTELLGLSPQEFYEITAANTTLWQRIREQGRRRELETHQLLTGETYIV